MATKIIRVETKVTGIDNADVVFEKDQSISLEADGSGGRQSTDDITVTDGILNMQFHGHGQSGQAWTLKIDQLAPDQGELFKKEGMIGSSAHSLIVDAVFV